MKRQIFITQPQSTGLLLHQQFLDLADICAAFQQMRSAGVSQRMRRDVLTQAGPVGSFGHNAHNIVVIECPPERLETNKRSNILKIAVSRLSLEVEVVFAIWSGLEK